MMDENLSKGGDFAAADALEAAFDWWREAGVDMGYSDTPSNWLVEPQSEETVAAPKPVKRIEEPKQTPIERAFQKAPAEGTLGGNGDAWPQDLIKFREWWLSEPSLVPAGPANRLPPRGVAGSKLMVIVGEPFEDDGADLLSGEAGQFAGAILRAAGIEPHEAYLASALPSPSALADWNELAKRGLDRLLKHHVALAAPERILVFGRGLAPLFNITPHEARDPAKVQAGQTEIPLLLAPQLAELARSAQRRRNFWNRWLEWTA